MSPRDSRYSNRRTKNTEDDRNGKKPSRTATRDDERGRPGRPRSRKEEPTNSTQRSSVVEKSVRDDPTAGSNRTKKTVTIVVGHEDDAETVKERKETLTLGDEVLRYYNNLKKDYKSKHELESIAREMNSLVTSSGGKQSTASTLLKEWKTAWLENFSNLDRAIAGWSGRPSYADTKETISKMRKEAHRRAYKELREMIESHSLSRQSAYSLVVTGSEIERFGQSATEWTDLLQHAFEKDGFTEQSTQESENQPEPDCTQNTDDVQPSDNHDTTKSDRTAKSKETKHTEPEMTNDTEGDQDKPKKSRKKEKKKQGKAKSSTSSFVWSDAVTWAAVPVVPAVLYGLYRSVGEETRSAVRSRIFGR